MLERPGAGCVDEPPPIPANPFGFALQLTRSVHVPSSVFLRSTKVWTQTFDVSDQVDPEEYLAEISQLQLLLSQTRNDMRRMASEHRQALIDAKVWHRSPAYAPSCTATVVLAPLGVRDEGVVFTRPRRCCPRLPFPQVELNSKEEELEQERTAHQATRDEREDIRKKMIARAKINREVEDKEAQAGYVRHGCEVAWMLWPANSRTHSLAFHGDGTPSRPPVQ